MWSQIIGHSRQIEELKKTLSSKLVPNAYLFSGLTGIGKKKIALAFASSLFCQNRPDACGECVSCVKIAKGVHPDVITIEPNTDRILIEQTRGLIRDLQYHPLEGDFKIAMVDRADVMTESAANAILKSLEEPTKNTLFILISAFPLKLLPTIRSRCRHITFSPLTEDDVREFLIKKCGLSPHIAGILAKISQGSIGAVSEMEEEFMDHTLNSFRIILSKSNAADIMSLAESWSSDASRMPMILDLLASLYRDLIIYRLTNSADHLIYKSYIAQGSPTQGKNEVLLTGITATRPISALSSDFDAIAAARNAIGSTVNKQLLFEQLLFTLSGGA